MSKGITPIDKSGTEEETTANESDDREKASGGEVPSPSAVHTPGFDLNLDFVKYTCNTRKTAMKEGDIITISSVTQSRVQIEGFTSGRNMLGCEFVKAVSGFNCRLCKAFIRCGNDVITHIKGKKHQKNYQTYVQEHPQYEEHQLARNKELEQVLEPKEGEEVVLYEVLDKDIKSSSSKQKSQRKDSQNEQQSEVPITKFVVAPEGDDEDAQLQINCDAADVDLDVGDLDNINEDSLLADQSGDEQEESSLEEKFPLFVQVEQFGDEEMQESEPSGTTPQLDVSAFASTT
ncbi:Zinc finger protein 318 [Stylophora pistillata]|uniref:Zinc finger protein 318 n=1 Tax=Stylophora pistillata TaxID=50429 RepID=A0A2B4S049_STYPI|nr:Zinc finger protein 318 [Stylophora pistillata]